jgi:hypothetical protein
MGVYVLIDARARGLPVERSATAVYEGYGAGMAKSPLPHPYNHQSSGFYP